MKRNGILRLFAIPGSIIIYAFWHLFRACTTMGYHSEIALRLLLGGLALILAFLAVVVVGAATMMCRNSASAARKSQTILIQKFTRCRYLLPYFMAGEIVLCGLAVSCLALAEIVWAVAHTSGAGSIKLILALIVAIGSILWMLFKSLLSIKKCFGRFTPEDTQIYGVNITETDAPVLWQWLRELTHKVQLTQPDNVVVGFFDCFYVTANAVQIEGGERLTGNTLYLPLTYMAALDKKEIAAVIGHELGHFTGEDTQYSLRFSPLYAGIENSLESMANNSHGSWVDRVVLRPSLDMGVWFLHKFHETVSYWSRIREHAADDTGAKVASATAFSSALLRICALDTRVSLHLDDIVRGRIEADNWLTSIVSGLQDAGRFDVSQGIDNEIMHPMDSHPTTRARIMALNIALDETLFDRASRPVGQDDNVFFKGLFSDVDALCISLSQKLAEKITPLREEQRQELEAEAGQATESTVFWLSMKGVWLMLLMSAFLLLVGGGMVLADGIKPGAFFLILAGILPLVLAKMFLKRARQPYFMLTRDSITSPLMGKPLPLQYVSDFRMVTVNGSVTIDLFVKEGYVPDIKTNRFMVGIRFSPQKQKVIISVPFGLLCESEGKKRKLDERELYDFINQYLISAHARAELERF